jgi:hypothetical protein
MVAKSCGPMDPLQKKPHFSVFAGLTRLRYILASPAFATYRRHPPSLYNGIMAPLVIEQYCPLSSRSSWDKASPPWQTRPHRLLPQGPSAFAPKASPPCRTAFGHKALLPSATRPPAPAPLPTQWLCPSSPASAAAATAIISGVFVPVAPSSPHVALPPQAACSAPSSTTRSFLWCL